MRITAVIPAYNEAQTIADVVRQVRRFVDEVIVVDDGSEDDTAHIARRAGARVIRLERNEGYIAAIKRGFAEAKGDVIVTLDADGEFPSESIPALVKPIVLDTADMVQGARSHIPRLSERVITWLAGRRAPVGDSGTGFRAMRASLARQLDIEGRCICGVLTLEALWRGARVVDVPVTLQRTTKPRRIAWYHVPQILYVLKWIIKWRR